jgi:DNA repair protein RecO (recombination protein O)
MIAQFELIFLAELGFGLDLTSCAATGAKDDLIYVSPRSGRAVSRAAGEAYRDKLMRLPDFLRFDGEPASAADVADAFALTGFFLDRHAFGPRGLALPDARARFVSAVLVRAG